MGASSDITDSMPQPKAAHKAATTAAARPPRQELAPALYRARARLLLAPLEVGYPASAAGPVRRK
jgi:hypothetical protein